MIAIEIILKIIKSKLTYIILSIILLCTNIFFIQQIIKINKNTKSNKKLVELSIENDILKKELAIVENKKVLEKSFTNSKIELEKLETRGLNETDKKIIDIVNNEFYNFMQNSSNKY